MFMAFNYIQEPETDERIIRKSEDRFNEVSLEDMEIKLVSVREVLTTRREETTHFEPKLSLS
jgi:hypothetical protein